MDVFAYESPHNDPTLSLDKKLAVDDGMLFVAVSADTVVGTVMAGYDGHRGWIYSLAVSADHRGHGIGTDLLMHAEKHLTAMGCMKVNLQIHGDNPGVQAFYISLGYETEPTISMGKRIPVNIPAGKPPSTS